MDRDKFIVKFLDTTNQLRRLIGDRDLTYDDLVRVGVEARSCDCEDPTCPGWGMAYEKSDDAEPTKVQEEKPESTLEEAFGLDPQDPGTAALELILGAAVKVQLMIKDGKDVGELVKYWAGWTKALLQDDRGTIARIRLTYEQAKTIFQAFGGEEECIVQVSHVVDGVHSGRGLYSHKAEYPEEGSVYLGHES